jgi:hypothetical protein
MIAATTSIEAELSAVANIQLNGGNSGTVGVALCDTTNGKIYSLEIIGTTSTAVLPSVVFQSAAWTLAACAGTPSAATSITVHSILTTFPAHVKLVKSGSNILAQYSQSGGSSYTTIATFGGIGTVAKAGITIRNNQMNVDWLSVAVN